MIRHELFAKLIVISLVWTAINLLNLLLCPHDIYVYDACVRYDSITNQITWFNLGPDKAPMKNRPVIEKNPQ